MPLASLLLVCWSISFALITRQTRLSIFKRCSSIIWALTLRSEVEVAEKNLPLSYISDQLVPPLHINSTWLSLCNGLAVRGPLIREGPPMLMWRHEDWTSPSHFIIQFYPEPYRLREPHRLPSSWTSLQIRAVALFKYHYKYIFLLNY